MMPRALREALALRDCYRQVFRSEAGKVVLNDLIRRFITNSPVADSEKHTDINVGMQEAVRWLCKKSLGNDREFEKAVRESYETTNQNEE